MSLLAAAVVLVLGGPVGSQPHVRWERGLEEAFRTAQKTQQPVMVDFWAEWCGWCKRLDHTTYQDTLVVKLSAQFVAVKVNTEGTPREVAFAQRHNVSSLPTIAFLTPEGRIVLRVDGYQGPGAFPQTLAQAELAASRVGAWEQALKRNAGDGAALTALGVYLYEQALYEESYDLLLRAVRHDKRLAGITRKETRLRLAVMEYHQQHYAAAETVLLEALQVKPEAPIDGKLMLYLGKTYGAAGKLEQARQTLKKVLEAAPSGPLAERARETLVALDRR